jgi:(1->4)-alpha-D-glucan 1-alpha-D-glucosylmutase
VGAAPWLGELKKENKRRDFVTRIQQYMNKAVHEAKRNLSWVNSNPEYISALEQFIPRILTAPGSRKLNHFWDEFVDFYPSVAYFGVFNALAQTLLKMTAPGVSDVYQGNELWDFSLVDPDNRRPVNFQVREKALRELQGRADAGDLVALCREVLRKYQDGRIKMWVAMRALNLRAEHPAVFQSNNYVPLQATGSKAEHVVAFARVHGDEVIITAVPRLSYTLAKGREHPPIGDLWADTELALPRNVPGLFWNAFTGQVCATSAARTLSCREIFADFPVALLAGR